MIGFLLLSYILLGACDCFRARVLNFPTYSFLSVSFDPFFFSFFPSIKQ